MQVAEVDFQAVSHRPEVKWVQASGTSLSVKVQSSARQDERRGCNPTPFRGVTGYEGGQLPLRLGGPQLVMIQKS